MSISSNDNDAGCRPGADELRLSERDLDALAERMCAAPIPFGRLAYYLQVLLRDGRNL
jgi:hypothetical protein